MMMDMEYDIGKLAWLGRQRIWLAEQLEHIESQIRDEIPAARKAEISHERIGAIVGRTRQTIIAWEKRKTGKAAPGSE